MKSEPKIFLSKSGTSIKVRVAVASDAQRLIKLKTSYIENSTTIPMNIDEYPADIDSESNLIVQYQNSPNSILLLAEIDNELIGNIDLTGSKRSKMAHTGMIGMGIIDKWRNQGLGRFLIESVIAWAKNHSDIEIIWLDVYDSNDLGYNLYKNTGFVVSGVIPDFFKEKDGFKDKIQMYQRIRKS